MIVICKESYDEFTGGLIVGKKYIVNKVVDSLVGVSDCKPVMEVLYDIKNDNGRSLLYSEKLFITLDDDRNNKLNELGI
jgi:hypothetical protein